VSFSGTGDIKVIRAEINQVLTEFIKQENKYLAKIGAELDPVGIALEKFLLDSGKRLRPLFAYGGLIGTSAKPNKNLLSAIAILKLRLFCLSRQRHRLRKHMGKYYQSHLD